MQISNMENLGAGIMGASMALNFAVHGREVMLHELRAVQLGKAMQTLRESPAEGVIHQLKRDQLHERASAWDGGFGPQDLYPAICEL